MDWANQLYILECDLCSHQEVTPENGVVRVGRMCDKLKLNFSNGMSYVKM